MFNYEIREGAKKLYHGICRTACENTAHKSHPVLRTYGILTGQRALLYSPLIFKVTNFRFNSTGLFPVRHYSTSPNDDIDIPSLTDFPIKFHPGIFTGINNLLVTYLTIKPNLDSSFSTYEFLNTTKKVVEIVSQKLAERDTESIREMVTPDVFQQITQNLTKFSDVQSKELAVKSDELFHSFLHDIVIKTDERTDDKSIEILSIHHVVKGLENFQNQSSFFQFNLIQEQMKKNPPRPYVLNYRFLRKFNRSGEGGEWIINALNHKSARKIEFNL